MFAISLYTYNGQYDTVNADKLIINTTDGQRTLLSNHMPVMFILLPGDIRVVHEGKTSAYTITTGVLHFENNAATILADEIIGEVKGASSKKGSQEKDLIMVKAELAKALKKDED
ncbi:MAG: hypothetical protein IJM15_02755 [Erysipelotrichaceae bacterium]|nr:hypothetical protein [Erysipelotrichaceae bacterium]